ncbi:hypothetical protein [Listeria valentina]|uniref:hypothetical protein n=1 Tax=Listeria valentina TaxID=2705293 RepID=UPI0014319A9B|nr:hypothetical protein [Listeria valentina]
MHMQEPVVKRKSWKQEIQVRSSKKNEELVAKLIEGLEHHRLLKGKSIIDQTSIQQLVEKEPKLAHLSVKGWYILLERSSQVSRYYVQNNQDSTGLILVFKIKESVKKV